MMEADDETGELVSYEYAHERPRLFNDEGQRAFLAWRDRANELLDLAGAFMLIKHHTIPGEGCCDTFFVHACADRMIELGELRELTGESVIGQHRVFVRRDPIGRSEPRRPRVYQRAFASEDD